MKQVSLRVGLLARLLARLLTGVGLIALGACAQVSVAPPAPTALFHDAWFAPAAEPVPTAEDLFRMSPQMLAYANQELGRTYRGQEALTDQRDRLINALYSNRRMRLQYDASTTRDAAQAFAARAGNCLSLVIMTAAFAKHLGLPLAYQSVDAPDFYSRNGGLTLASSHVNLVLSAPQTQGTASRRISRGLEDLTIDFLPQSDLRGQRTVHLAEATVVAMFLNNRAVELLATGQVDAAYAHARAALLQDPGFLPSVNTLGVIYDHKDQPAAAEAAFAHVLKREPDHLSTLSNQAQLLVRLGRPAEAEALSQRLARLQPVAPFQHFNEGRRAMERGDYAQARDLFVRELRLQPYQEEVHFWAAQAYWRLGDRDQAARHLAQAAEHSNTRSEHDRYAGKLARLREQPPQP